MSNLSESAQRSGTSARPVPRAPRGTNPNHVKRVHRALALKLYPLRCQDVTRLQPRQLILGLLSNWRLTHQRRPLLRGPGQAVG